jgi:hypothetical protein
MTTGYKPLFQLPIIGPPPAGFSGSPSDFYAALNATVTAVTAIGPSPREGLVVSVAPIAQTTIYAISGGTITFFPAGKPIPSPDNQIAPTGGALVLSVWVGDFLKQKTAGPAGTEPVARYIYMGVQDVGLAITAAVATEKKPALAKFWEQQQTMPAPDDLDMLKDHFFAGVMTGLASVFVDGGTELGKTTGTFTLQQLDGGSPKKYVSPVTSLKVAARFDTTDTKDRWKGHPLLKAIENLPMPVEFHLKFTIWNVKTKQYAPISNATASVVQTTANGDAPIVTANTDIDGIAHLSHPDLMQLAPDERKLHFEIDLTSSVLHFDRDIEKLVHFPMPWWSTKGWLSVDGLTDGYYNDFAGQTIGTNNMPVEFRVGFDFHVYLERIDNFQSSFGQFPPHSYVRVNVNASQADPLDLETDETGTVHGVLYNVADIHGDISNKSLYKIVDPAKDKLNLSIEFAQVRINTGTVMTRAYFVQAGSLANDRNQSFPIRALPTLNDTVTLGGSLSIDTANAVYVLQCFEEMLATMKLLTDSEPSLMWKPGDPHPGLKFSFVTGTATEVSRSSYNNLSIEFARRDFNETKRRNDTIFHEIGHCIHFITTIDQQDYNQFAADYFSPHYARSLSTETFAMFEGFAEFFSALFGRPESIFHLFPNPNDPEPLNPQFHWSEPFKGLDPNDPGGFMLPLSLDYVLVLLGRVSFGAPRDQLGYRVEGAFATALYLLFNEHVANRPVWNPATVERTTGSCKVETVNAWMTPDAKTRFMEKIWRPFLTLSGRPETTRECISAITAAAKAAGTWPAIKATLNKLHIAVDEPKMIDIFRNNVPVTNLQAMIAYPDVQITGEGFVDGITVEIKNSQNAFTVATINVITDLEMQITVPPLYAGTYDMLLTTMWGEKAFPNTITVVN